MTEIDAIRLNFSPGIARRPELHPRSRHVGVALNMKPADFKGITWAGARAVLIGMAAQFLLPLPPGLGAHHGPHGARAEHRASA